MVITTITAANTYWMSLYHPRNSSLYWILIISQFCHEKIEGQGRYTYNVTDIPWWVSKGMRIQTWNRNMTLKTKYFKTESRVQTHFHYIPEVQNRLSFYPNRNEFSSCSISFLPLNNRATASKIASSQMTRRGADEWFGCSHSKGLHQQSI